MKKYQVIYADPPWEIGKFGKGRDSRIGRKYKVGEAIKLPYKSMTIKEICNLKVKDISADECHLWLWSTNRTLHDAFHVIEAWGFKYLNTITFIKPAGVGAWFINTTQHLLFAYKGKLKFGIGRYAKTSQFYTPIKHSKKPDYVYDLIDSISPYKNRLELFARQKQLGWDVWGNEIDSSIEIKV